MSRPPIPQQQPQVTPVIDPDNVPETFCSGPVNVAHIGPLAILTFTTTRPEASDMFQGKVNLSAVVRARIVLTRADLAVLHDTIDRAIKAAASGSGNVTPLTGGAVH
jgi:hypothetical protein